MGNSPLESNKRNFSGDTDLDSYNINPQFPGVSFPTKRQKKSLPNRLDDVDICEIPNELLNVSKSHCDLSEVTSLFEATNLNRNLTTQLSDQHLSESVVFPTDEDLFAGNNIQPSTQGPTSSTSMNGENQNLYFSVKKKSDIFDKMAEESGSMNKSSLVSTVFRWNGGGNEIYISGTFNNWGKKIEMVKHNTGAWVIIECPPGRHEYKYFIDGAWYHDPTKPFTENRFGTKNNVIDIQVSDQDVLASLKKDIENSKHSNDEGSKIESRCNSPPGEYTQIVPPDPNDLTKLYSHFGDLAKNDLKPPVLPQQLLNGLLNKETDNHCDPNLLPQPNHVMVNHLYALSIKNGVIVLSVISRYRKKFVSTLFYKPIDSPSPLSDTKKQ